MNTACRRAEKLVDKIAQMDRTSLVQELRQMRCDFKMDFSDDFLDTVSLERLQHIVLAAFLHDHRKSAKVPV
jgi:hypothetical protein